MAKDGKNVVNLDALIPRADLFEQTTAVNADSTSLRITDLEPGVMYGLLRKPDFQRETANWTPSQVVNLIETFCDSDIIPAIILWQNGSQVFVVDGAHRLSALVAWVHNDFGAGAKSLSMFKGKIPDHQRAMAEQTAELLNRSVGPWATYKTANAILSMKQLPVQWIEGRSAAQAASAFIRINQGGTVIDQLEVRILTEARSALSVATRVIARGGTGHAYWQHFSKDDAKTKTPMLGAEIYKLLYDPPLELPIKTIEVPLAGLGYGPAVIRFAFDLVAQANDLSVPDSTRKVKAGEAKRGDDLEGTETLAYLKRAKRAVQMILSNQPFSLGLHPALYFYTAGGSFQPAAFLNILAWVTSLDKSGRLDSFRKVRGAFEDLILAHPNLIKPSVHRLGTGTRTRSRMIELLDKILERLTESPDTQTAWQALKIDFPNLATEEPADGDASEGVGKSFSETAKNAVTMSDLDAAPRCGLCNGLLHRNGKVVDHIDEKSKGGSSHSKNGRWVHPICNSNREKDLLEAAKKPS